MQMDHAPILIGSASRPYPTETVNGDVWHVDWHATGCRIAMIDGLGHGLVAAEAAALARETLMGKADAGPVETMQSCHEMLRQTRGAAVFIVTIDLAAGLLDYLGVGNVEARLQTGAKTVHLASQRGIVGSVLPALRPGSEVLHPNWVLLLHTDGIRNRFELSTLMDSHSGSLQGLAETILTSWGRDTDDATVLVAKPRR
jgi:serine phosphatase RsbU (regulator of sigma subunit)